MKSQTKQPKPLTEARREISRLSKRLTRLAALLAQAQTPNAPPPVARLDVDMLSLNALRCREITIEDQFGNDRVWIGVERITGNTVLHLYPARGGGLVMLTTDELGGHVEVQSPDKNQYSSLSARGLMEAQITEVNLCKHPDVGSS